MGTITPFGPHRASGSPVSTGSKLVLLFLVFSSSILCCCDAFAPSRPSGRVTVTLGTIRPPEQLHHLSVPGQRMASIRVSHALFQKVEDDDNEETTQANLQDSTPDTGESGKKELSGMTKGWKKVTFALDKVYSYIMITLGTFLTAGLLLNILGYSYQVTDHGIVIDTLENMRKDAQFHNAVFESMRDIKQ
jgi:hypothetical protein